jgi:hypothetical protein
MPVAVFGLINYALNYRALYPYPPIWPNTPNFTISLMYHHFVSMFNRPDCPRAPELNETSDGSPKEYKNILYLAFAAFKVLVGWFETVQHYFLGPGHSHDAQDQTWKVLKSSFYSSRVITFPAFTSLCQRSFSSNRPEVITDMLVFDWESWLSPWVQHLRNHTRWRAFQFSRSPTNLHSVVMKWKESESSSDQFHGSEQFPDGIELLFEIPFGHPQRIEPIPIAHADLEKIPKCLPDMNSSEQLHWEETIAEQELPDTGLARVPDRYFDFHRFDYTTWHEEHPETFRIPVSVQQGPRPIEIDETIGNFFTCNK